MKKVKTTVRVNVSSTDHGSIGEVGCLRYYFEQCKPQKTGKGDIGQEQFRLEAFEDENNDGVDHDVTADEQPPYTPLHRRTEMEKYGAAIAIGRSDVEQASYEDVECRRHGKWHERKP